MKHLLSITDLSTDEIHSILHLAGRMHQLQEARVKKLPYLKGRTVVNLFFEDSTRTRSSFELAAKWLSADAINVSARGSSVSKGESMRDTLMTLDAMGVDAIVMRHPGSGSVAHAMLTHFTRTKLGTLEGKLVSITGDLLHSRVVRSNVALLSRLGARVVLVAPHTLLPPGVETWGVQVTPDLDEVISDVDVAMMLRVQRERMHGGFFPSEREYVAAYGLTASRLTRLRPTAVIAHPGPMNRGLEISSTAADDPRSIVLDQVSSGVAVRMSVLHHLLAD